MQGGLLKDALELVKAQNGNGRTRYTIKPMEEKLSFDKGFYVFIRAVQMLVSNNKGVVVVNSSQTLPADTPTACSTVVGKRGSSAADCLAPCRWDLLDPLAPANLCSQRKSALSFQVGSSRSLCSSAACHSFDYDFGVNF